MVPSWSRVMVAALVLVGSGPVLPQHSPTAPAFLSPTHQAEMVHILASNGPTPSSAAAPPLPPPTHAEMAHIKRRFGDQVADNTTVTAVLAQGWAATLSPNGSCTGARFDCIQQRGVVEDAIRSHIC
jgi:hypothetical protein